MITLAKRVSVRAWPGLPGPTTPAGTPVVAGRAGWMASPVKVRQLQRGYGLRPSSRRVGVSTPCMTVSAGVTSCGRRGSGSGRTGVRPGWIGSPWRGGGLRGGPHAARAPARPPRGVVSSRAGRRVEIPKPRGGKRPLGIPTVADRVAQAAAKIVLEPIFEADFMSCSYGFRPKRSATQAMERSAYRVHRGLPVRGRSSTSRNFFGEIDHDRLLAEVGQAGVGSAGAQTGPLVAAGRGDGRRGVQRTVAGTPQGGVISPLLANIYLHVLDTELAARGVGELVRYADDGVVLCRSRGAGRGGPGGGAERSWRRWGCSCIRARRRWSTCGKAGRVWISSGCHFRARMSGRLWEQKRIVRYYLHRWPSQTAMKRLREKVRDRPAVTARVPISAT